MYTAAAASCFLQRERAGEWISCPRAVRMGRDRLSAILLPRNYITSTVFLDFGSFSILIFLIMYHNVA